MFVYSVRVSHAMLSLKNESLSPCHADDLSTISTLESKRLLETNI